MILNWDQTVARKNRPVRPRNSTRGTPVSRIGADPLRVTPARTNKPNPQSRSANAHRSRSDFGVRSSWSRRKSAST